MHTYARRYIFANIITSKTTTTIIGQWDISVISSENNCPKWQIHPNNGETSNPTRKTIDLQLPRPNLVPDLQQEWGSWMNSRWYLVLINYVQVFDIWYSWWFWALKFWEFVICDGYMCNMVMLHMERPRASNTSRIKHGQQRDPDFCASSQSKLI